MAECDIAHVAMHKAVLKEENERLGLELRDKERNVELLSQSNGQLAAHVQQLKAIIKDAHVRYEDDLQRTVAKLQDQYESAVELMQLGVGLAAPSQPKAEVRTSSQLPSATSIGISSVSAASSGCCTGVHRPSTSTRPPPQQQQQQQQPQRQAAPGARCKCPRAAAAAASMAGGSCPLKQATRQPAPDPRLSMLGLSADDFSPSAAYGTTVGLTTEPLAVLRDVLNLDGGRDSEREQQLRGRSLSAGATASAAGGPLLAQAQFEARLRGAYRSMLLQLQHRYQLERERQEDAHKAALQEQEARHLEELEQLAAGQEADMAAVARRLERQEAAWGAEVARLQAELAAAKAAAESSQSQAGAARAAVESFQAQLLLLRNTHEAELQHVRQGSMPVEEHAEIVRRLRAEWEAALQQRERDYSALLEELREVRRQLSSTAEQSRSSGNSCGHGSSVVSPLPPPPPATGAGAGPAAAPARPTHDPHTATSVHERFSHSRNAVDHHHQQDHNHQHNHHDQQLYHQQQHRHSRHQGRQQWDWEDDMAPGREHVPEAAAGGGLRARLDLEPSRMGRWEGQGPGGGVRCPSSPAGSAHSVAPSLDLAAGAEADDHPAATPRSRATVQRGGTTELPLPPPPPSSSSSRLSDLVDAVLHGSSSARRGLALDGPVTATAAAAESAAQPVRHPSASHPAPAAGAPGGASDSSGGAGGSSGCGDLRSSDGGRRHEEYGHPGHHHHQQQQQRHGRDGGRAGGADRAGDGGKGGGGSSCGGGRQVEPSSPDQHNSEVTLGRWQPREAPPADPLDGTADRASSPQAQPPRPRPNARQGGGSPFAGAVTHMHRAADQPSQPRPPKQLHQQPRTAGGAPAQPRKEDKGPAVVRFAEWAPAQVREARQSPSPPARPASPLRGGRLESSWGRSGNPAAAVQMPRCLRCGLNDVTSPGCCRFHPALLSQPGGLRFTPEYMTCQAADHTVCLPGCLVRKEHFYEPQGLIPQATSVPPATATVTVAAVRRQVSAPERPSRMELGQGNGDGGGGGGCSAEGGSGGGATNVARALRGERKCSGGGGGGMAAPASPLRRAPATRSPWRGGAARMPGSSGGGAGAGGGGSGDGAGDSPSPQPRTRLPSPMRR